VDVNKPHLANIGRMIEDMEFDMRSNLNELYVMKTREIIHSLHRVSDGPVQQSAFIASLNAAVISKGAKNISSLTGDS
jgi:capping protein beta